MIQSAILRRPAVVRRGRRLEYFTIAWNALEGLVAVIAGALAGSISLVGFGIDSFIEVTSGAALLWRMSVDADVQRRDYLVAELKTLGLWNEEVRNRLKLSDGSIRGISEIPEEIRAVYRTAWEIPMRSLIDMAADRGAFIDQSQSLNLFVQSPNIASSLRGTCMRGKKD